MTAALITGASGQDGVYLSRLLLEEGLEVHGTVRPGSTATVDPGIVTHSVDIRDSEGLRTLVAQLRPAELYHLAGQSSVGASWVDPVGTVAQTGSPTASLLHAIETHSPHTRFVNASSSEIFGLAPSPQNEETPIAPVSPYGAAKALGHFLVAAFRSKGLHASSCILYNHESPLRDERFVTGKIAAGVARIVQGRQDHLELGDLDVRRDWGWAPDYVDALRGAARHGQPGDYVIGTGVAHSIRDFVESAFRAADIHDWRNLVRFDPTLSRPADPATQCADASKARTELNWAPTKPFDEIVAAMVEVHLARS